MLANVVNVQLRTNKFIDTSHQKKLIKETSSTKEIYIQAKELLEQMYIRGQAIRLIGIRVDGLEEKEKQQISLFDNVKDEKQEKQEKLDTAIDKLKEKYGYNLITRAGKMEVENIIKFRKDEIK